MSSVRLTCYKCSRFVGTMDVSKSGEDTLTAKFCPHCSIEIYYNHKGNTLKPGIRKKETVCSECGNTGKITLLTSVVDCRSCTNEGEE